MGSFICRSMGRAAARSTGYEVARPTSARSARPNWARSAQARQDRRSRGCSRQDRGGKRREFVGSTLDDQENSVGEFFKMRKPCDTEMLHDRVPLYTPARPTDDSRSLMDFVERLFGVWPDGGNGSFEVLLIAVGVVIAVGALVLRRNIPRTTRTS